MSLISDKARDIGRSIASEKEKVLLDELDFHGIKPNEISDHSPAVVTGPNGCETFFVDGKPIVKFMPMTSSFTGVRMGASPETVKADIEYQTFRDGL